MFQGEEQSSGVEPAGDGLESYRRLIELQKQMIELSQKHEQSKHAYAALRKLVASEIAKPLVARRPLRHRLKQSASRLLNHVPGFASVSANLRSFGRK